MPFLNGQIRSIKRRIKVAFDQNMGAPLPGSNGTICQTYSGAPFPSPSMHRCFARSKLCADRIPLGRCIRCVESVQSSLLNACPSSETVTGQFRIVEDFGPR